MIAATAPRTPNLPKAALWYARHGFRVFPCLARGKTPLTAHGCKDATVDVAQVAAWWRQWPDANIGVATGAGLVVLDVDAAGLDWFDAAPLDLVPAYTPTVATPGGGYHKWYATAPDVPIPNSAGRVAPGVDVRGAGGYVIAPPSIHPNGAAYAWAGDTIAERAPAAAPAALLRLMQPPAAPHLENNVPSSPSPDLAARKMDRALARAGTEGRNNMGFWLACQLRDNGIGEMTAEAVLLDYARRAPGRGGDPYTDREALASVAQAYRAPARTPDPISPPRPVATFRGNDQDGWERVTAPHLENPVSEDVDPAELPGIVASLAAALAAERTAHAETRAQLDKRNAAVQWTHDIMRMPNTPPGEKITLYFARWQIEYEATHPRDEPPPKAAEGMVRLNLAGLAEVSGQSAAAVGRHIKHASETGILRRRAVKALAADGSKRTQVYVHVPPEFYTKPSLLAPDTKPNWGGKRDRCEGCGGVRLKAVVFRCQDCGHEQAAPDVPDEDAAATLAAPPPARKRRRPSIGAIMAVDALTATHLENIVPTEDVPLVAADETAAPHLENNEPASQDARLLPSAYTTGSQVRKLSTPLSRLLSSEPSTLRDQAPGSRCWGCLGLRPCACETVIPVAALQRHGAIQRFTEAR